MKSGGEWPLKAWGKRVARGEYAGRQGSWLLIFLLVMPFSSAQAGTVSGTVKNGTTGRLAAGVELTLVQPMGGMRELAHAKSGPHGEFSFDNPNIGAQPILVQAEYQGVRFTAAVPPGNSSATVQLEIFEPSKDPHTIDVASHFVIFQPNGATLRVAEQYQVENKSEPPHAYFRKDGTFDFALPEEGELERVDAAGPTGMPVQQLPMDKKKNRYSIAYAFRPGDNSVRYSYHVPYPGNAAALKIPTIYPGGRLLLVAPPTMEVRGDGFSAAGQEQGMNLYLRQDVPAGALVAVNVSGTAPTEGAAAGAGQQAQGRDAQSGSPESGGAEIQAVPGRLDAMKWPLLGGFVVVFGVFAYLLSRKTVVAVNGAEVTQVAPASTPKGKKEKSQPAITAPRASAAPPAAKVPSNGPAALSEIDAAVGTSLDALKESLFRLELRHQAGTITEEDYARERAKAEKVLRDLVRG
jgi:hypothetical protein